jgi:hypothetical protein
MQRLLSIKSLLLLLLTSTGCLHKMALRSLGVYDSTISPKAISNDEKKIVFLGMHHLGRKEFYDDAIFKLDSLKRDGYFIFLEGVDLGSNSDSILLNNSLLKFRSILGVDLSAIKKNKGYIDTATGLSVLPSKQLNKIIKMEKFINQPSALKNISDTLIGKKVDGNVIDLIKDYENKYGTISLSEYDTKTPLGTSYDRKQGQKLSLDKKNFLLIDARNKIIIDNIISRSNKKIAIVYGKAHYAGLLKLLKASNKGFNEIK